jgi:hypothetical protein
VRQRLCFDAQLQACPLDRRAEDGREIGRQPSEIAGHETRFHPFRFDTGEVKQCVDQSQETQPVAIGDVKFVAVIREAIRRIGDGTLKRTE